MWASGRGCNQDAALLKPNLSSCSMGFRVALGEAAAPGGPVRPQVGDDPCARPVFNAGGPPVARSPFLKTRELGIGALGGSSRFEVGRGGLDKGLRNSEVAGAFAPSMADIPAGQDMSNKGAPVVVETLVSQPHLWYRVFGTD